MSKNLGFSLLLLAAAALLEAGGDAFMRGGVREGRWWSLLPGAVCLCGYGVVVNLPDWDFGRLLGIYIAVFFVAAQVIAYLAYGQRLTRPVAIGGALIVAGGLVLSLWSEGSTN